MPDRPLIRVAHAYGNSRSRIEEAVAAGADLIEADLRYRRGDVDVRHDYRLPLLPVLYNRGLRGIHKQWPWSISFGSTVIHLDLERMRLRDLLACVSGRSGLMLDLKRAAYEPDVARALVQRVADDIDASGFVGALEFCGYWPLLDLIRDRVPGATLRYSIDTPHDWQRLLGRLDGLERIDSVTLQRDLLTPERARVLQRERLTFFCWDIETIAEAHAAIAKGSSGIIADDLAILAALERQPLSTGGS